VAGARASFRLRDLDRGWQSIMREARKLDAERGLYAKAGMLGEKALEKHPEEAADGAAAPSGGALTNVQLLAVHEFGTDHVPERSGVRAAFDLHRVTYVAQLRALVGTWFDRKGKMPLRQALGIMGLKMVADQRARVLEGAGIPPPNAPSTLARKIRAGWWKSAKFRDSKGRYSSTKGQTEMPRPLVDTARMIGALSHEVAGGNDERSTT
jgi:hypothetical protein